MGHRYCRFHSSTLDCVYREPNDSDNVDDERMLDLASIRVVIALMVVVFCTRLCLPDSRSSASMLVAEFHSRCSSGFLNSTTFLLLHHLDHTVNLTLHDDAVDKMNCDDVNDSCSDDSSCDDHFCDHRQSNRHRRHPCSAQT